MARKKDVSLNKKGKKTHQGMLFAIAVILTFFCISTGSNMTETDTVQVGAVAEKRYVAERDAIDVVTTERLKEAAADSVAPIYMHDSVAEENSRTEVNEMFQELNRILSKLKEGESFYEKAMEAPWKLPVVLAEKHLDAYADLDSANRILFVEDCINAMNGVYEKGIKAEALEAGRTAAEEAFENTPWNRTLKEMAATVFDAALEPNLVVDDDAMEAEREAKRAEVENVMIRKNQKIVDEGEIITQDIYDRLVSLELVGSAEYTGTFLPLMGSLLMMGGYLAGMAMFGAIIRDKTPVGKAGMFQGQRIVGQVLIPGIIGPAIGAAVLKGAELIVNDDGTTSFIPNRNIFLAAFIAAAFIWIRRRRMSVSAPMMAATRSINSYILFWMKRWSAIKIPA